MTRALAVTVVMLLGCRTEIVPVLRAQKVMVERGPSVAPGNECEVRDFPAATDLPTGAQNLGWLTVPHDNETDEKTFEALRKAVCSKGGNAFSQARWVRAPNASVADHPTELEANAWLIP